MKRNEIPQPLLKDIQVATNNIYRYDRFDRFALITVLNAAEKNKEVEDVFVEQAKMALKRHPVNKQFAA